MKKRIMNFSKKSCIRADALSGRAVISLQCFQRSIFKFDRNISHAYSFTTSNIFCGEGFIYFLQAFTVVVNE